MKKYCAIALAVLPFVLVGILHLPPLGPTSTVYGEVTGIRALEGDGVRFFLEVTLDSDQEVLVKVRRFSENFKEGERIRLHKMEPLGFGVTEYVFQGYVSKTET